MTPETGIHELKVADYMTTKLITAPYETALPDALRLMATNRVGNLIIMGGHNERQVDLLTERRILQYVSVERAVPNRPVKDIMFHPFIKITPETGIFSAARAMIKWRARLLVFDDKDKLIGIITASDIVRAFSKTTLNPSLDRTMNRKIFALDSSDTIFQAIRLMDMESVGSVIVNEDNNNKKNTTVYGIFTERDLVSKVLSKGIDLDTTIKDYASTPLVTAHIGINASNAAQVMGSNRIKRLPLTEDGNPMAMVTARDVVEAFTFG